MEPSALRPRLAFALFLALDLLVLSLEYGDLVAGRRVSVQTGMLCTIALPLLLAGVAAPRIPQSIFSGPVPSARWRRIVAYSLFSLGILLASVLALWAFQNLSY